MNKDMHCTQCGSCEIGEGILDGYAVLIPKGKLFSSSGVVADVCSECGLILSMHVKHPQKFKPKG